MVAQGSNLERDADGENARPPAGRFCVLVNSSDRARDVFEIVYRNAETVWRGCDWPRYVGFTSQHSDMYGFKAIAADGPAGWREQLGAQLDRLPAEIEYVLRLEEDFLFLSPVDGEKLDAIAEVMDREGLVYVSMLPVPRSLLGRAIEFVRRKKSRRPLRPLSFSEPYYCSLMPAIWKRSYLRELLRQPGNIWEFEHVVTDRPHYAVWERALDFDAIVAKGTWLPRAARQLERQGLSLSNSQREFQTLRARLRDLRQRIAFAIVGFTGFRLRQKLNLLPNLPKELKRDQLETMREGQQ